jgi:hypothetical protein
MTDTFAQAARLLSMTQAGETRKARLVKKTVEKTAGVW